MTAGERHDSTQLIDIIDGLDANAVLADRGYDADSIVEFIEKNGGEAVIPPKKNRIVQRNYDVHLYKERHKVECLFGFLKHYRRLFSRFDKLKSRFEAFLHFGAALQWLK